MDGGVDMIRISHKGTGAQGALREEERANKKEKRTENKKRRKIEMKKVYLRRILAEARRRRGKREEI